MYYRGEIELKQGESVELSFFNGEEEITSELIVQNDGYAAEWVDGILTLNADCVCDGSSFWVYASADGMIFGMSITPTLAEPFTGVTFETSNARTLMTWENVPNLYSFNYSINSGEEREVTAGENTSLDITSYLPENARRALVEITDITYSYPIYDDNGEPTEETRKVVHDDVMKFVAEY